MGNRQSRAIDDHTAAPPFLLITRDTLQFYASSTAWLDVAAFASFTESIPNPAPSCEDLSALEEAVAL